MPDEKLSEQPNDIIRIREVQLSDGRDLEKALEAAERMLAEADARRRHEQNRTFTVWSLVIVVAVFLAASLFAIHPLHSFTYYFVSVGVSLALFIVLFSLLGTQYRRSTQYDFTLRLVSRLVSLINESYLEVAERERWSYLRREATKIRLSAFSLGKP